MNKLLAFGLTLFVPAAALAAPTEFVSPNYKVESVHFGYGAPLVSSYASVPPTITDGPTVSAITTSSLTISWKTDKPANSVVSYAKTGLTTLDQIGQLTSATFTTHVVTLNNLERGTSYTYRVSSSDVAGNLTQSALSTATTDPGDITPPRITVAPAITVDSATSVTVYWETNEVANSTVEYGLKDVAENTIGKPDELTLQHRVQVNGLLPAQSYQLRIKSKDASGNVTAGETVSLTSPNAPAVSGLNVTGATLTSFQVEWNTTLPATTVVRYGKTPELDQSVQDVATYSEKHFVRLSDLSSGTTYYVKVSGTDQSGNLFSSDVYIAKTVTQPIITDFAITGVGESGATLSWNASSEIDALVQTQITDSYDPSLVGKLGSAGTDKLAATHTFPLDSLESDSRYCVTVTGKDVFGNRATSKSECFRTKQDSIPPQITNVKIIENNNPGTKGSQVLISFGSSEPTSAVIEYGSGAAGSYDKKANLEEDGLSRSHLGIMSGLEAGNSYHFRITVIDRAKNATVSADYLVGLERIQPTLIDLIFRQVSDNFGWLNRLGGAR